MRSAKRFDLNYSVESTVGYSYFNIFFRLEIFCSKKQTDEYQKIFGGLTALMNKFASPRVCVSLS